MYMDSRKVLDKYFNEYQHFYNCLMYLCIWNECNEFAPGNSKNKVNKVENILNNYVLITEDEKTNLGKYITVKFLDEEGSEEEVYQLVGTVQANPLEQKISDESPLGKVILHAKIGDKVLVNTEDGEKFEVKIIDISEELGKKNKSVKKNK